MLPLPKGAVWQTLLFLCAAFFIYEVRSEGRVVCYYTNWSVYRPGTAKFNPQNINPYLCTHLVYAFGGFTKDNQMKPFDKYQDIEQGGYAKFTGLKTYNKQLKTMIAIGGWNEASSRFSPLVANPERRQQFIKNILKFLRQNHFDGIDLDWEYPAHREGGKARDRDNYAQFVQDLRAEFERESSKTGRPRLLLTMAVPAGIEYIEKGYDIPKLNKYLDWFNVLTYDFHSSHEPSVNHHAPLYSLEEESEYNYDTELNIDYSIKFYLKAGADRDKLVLGIPTYGRSYTLINEESTEIGAPAEGPGEQGDATREKGYLAYYEICQNIKDDPEWTVIQPNPNAMGPYAFRRTQWVGYDDEDIVRKKAEYVVAERLGGIMFWAIDNDDFRGTCTGKPYPLIEAAKEAMLDGLGLGINEVSRPSAPKKPTRARSRENTSSDSRNRISGNSKGTDYQELSRKPNNRNRPQSTTTVAPTTTVKLTEAEGSSLYIGRRTTTPPPPTTPDPGTDFKCEEEGFFQHPRDCKKYYWCLDSGPSGLGIVAHMFTCPSGLYFNPAADSCDFSRNVPCKIKKSTTSSPITSTTSTPTTSRPTSSNRITAATSRTSFLRTTARTTTTTTSTTTLAPEVDDTEYEDDTEEESPAKESNSEEDPKVLKELIDLIRKVGGIEELEKHLLRKADGTVTIKNSSTTSTDTTNTPSPISKSIYEKVLSRPGSYNSFRNRLTSTALYRKPAQTKTENPAIVTKQDINDDTERTNSDNYSKYSSVVRSRQGPQSEGLDKLPDFDSFLKEPKKYVTINRQRGDTTKIKESADDEDFEEPVEEEDQVLLAEEEENISSTRRPITTPSYVSIRRSKPTTTTLSSIDAEIEDDDEVQVSKDEQKTYTTLNRNRNKLSTSTDTQTEDIISTTNKYKYIERSRPTSSSTAFTEPIQKKKDARAEIEDEDDNAGDDNDDEDLEDSPPNKTVQYKDDFDDKYSIQTTTTSSYANLNRRTTTTVTPETTTNLNFNTDFPKRTTTAPSYLNIETTTIDNTEPTTTSTTKLEPTSKTTMTTETTATPTTSTNIPITTGSPTSENNNDLLDSTSIYPNDLAEPIDEIKDSQILLSTQTTPPTQNPIPNTTPITATSNTDLVENLEVATISTTLTDSYQVTTLRTISTTDISDSADTEVTNFNKSKFETPYKYNTRQRNITLTSTSTQNIKKNNDNNKNSNINSSLNNSSNGINSNNSTKVSLNKYSIGGRRQQQQQTQEIFRSKTQNRYQQNSTITTSNSTELNSPNQYLGTVSSPRPFGYPRRRIRPTTTTTTTTTTEAAQANEDLQQKEVNIKKTRLNAQKVSFESPNDLETNQGSNLSTQTRNDSQKHDDRKVVGISGTSKIKHEVNLSESRSEITEEVVVQEQDLEEETGPQRSYSWRDARKPTAAPLKRKWVKATQLSSSERNRVRATQLELKQKNKTNENLENIVSANKLVGEVQDEIENREDLNSFSRKKYYGKSLNEKSVDIVIDLVQKQNKNYRTRGLKMVSDLDFAKTNENDNAGNGKTTKTKPSSTPRLSVTMRNNIETQTQNDNKSIDFNGMESESLIKIEETPTDSTTIASLSQSTVEETENNAAEIADDMTVTTISTTLLMQQPSTLPTEPVAVNTDENVAAEIDDDLMLSVKMSKPSRPALSVNTYSSSEMLPSTTASPTPTTKKLFVPSIFRKRFPTSTVLKESTESSTELDTITEPTTKSTKKFILTHNRFTTISPTTEPTLSSTNGTLENKTKTRRVFVRKTIRTTNALNEKNEENKIEEIGDNGNKEIDQFDALNELSRNRTIINTKTNANGTTKTRTTFIRNYNTGPNTQKTVQRIHTKIVEEIPAEHEYAYDESVTTKKPITRNRGSVKFQSNDLSSLLASDYAGKAKTTINVQKGTRRILKKPRVTSEREEIEENEYETDNADSREKVTNHKSTTVPTSRRTRPTRPAKPSTATTPFSSTSSTNRIPDKKPRFTTTPPIVSFKNITTSNQLTTEYEDLSTTENSLFKNNKRFSFKTPTAATTSTSTTAQPATTTKISQLPIEDKALVDWSKVSEDSDKSTEISTPGVDINILSVDSPESTKQITDAVKKNIDETTINTSHTKATQIDKSSDENHLSLPIYHRRKYYQYYKDSPVTYIDKTNADSNVVQNSSADIKKQIHEVFNISENHINKSADPAELEHEMAMEQARSINKEFGNFLGQIPVVIEDENNQRGEKLATNSANSDEEVLETLSSNNNTPNDTEDNELVAELDSILEAVHSQRQGKAFSKFNNVEDTTKIVSDDVTTNIYSEPQKLKLETVESERDEEDARLLRPYTTFNRQRTTTKSNDIEAKTTTANRKYVASARFKPSPRPTTTLQPTLELENNDVVQIKSKNEEVEVTTKRVFGLLNRNRFSITKTTATPTNIIEDSALNRFRNRTSSLKLKVDNNNKSSSTTVKPIRRPYAGFDRLRTTTSTDKTTTENDEVIESSTKRSYTQRLKKTTPKPENDTAEVVTKNSFYGRDRLSNTTPAPKTVDAESTTQSSFILTPTTERSLKEASDFSESTTDNLEESADQSTQKENTKESEITETIIEETSSPSTNNNNLESQLEDITTITPSMEIKETTLEITTSQDSTIIQDKTNEKSSNEGSAKNDLQKTNETSTSEPTTIKTVEAGDKDEVSSGVDVDNLRKENSQSTKTVTLSMQTEENKNSKLNQSTTTAKTLGLRRRFNSTKTTTTYDNTQNSIKSAIVTRRPYAGLNRQRFTPTTATESAVPIISENANETEKQSTVDSTERRRLVTNANGQRYRPATRTTTTTESPVSSVEQNEISTDERVQSTVLRTYGGLNRQRFRSTTSTTESTPNELEANENRSTTRRNYSDFNRQRLRTTTENSVQKQNPTAQSTTRPAYAGFNRLRLRTTTESTIAGSNNEIVENNREENLKSVTNDVESNETVEGSKRKIYAGFNRQRLRTTTESFLSVKNNSIEIRNEKDSLNSTNTILENNDTIEITTRRPYSGFYRQRLRSTTESALLNGVQANEIKESLNLKQNNVASIEPIKYTGINRQKLRSTTTESVLASINSRININKVEEENLKSIEINEENSDTIDTPSRKTYGGLNRQPLKSTTEESVVSNSNIGIAINQDEDESLKSVEINVESNETNEGSTRRTYVGLDRQRLKTTTENVMFDATTEIEPNEIDDTLKQNNNNDIEINDTIKKTTRRTYLDLNRQQFRTTTNSPIIENSSGIESNEVENSLKPMNLNVGSNKTIQNTTRRTYANINRQRQESTTSSTQSNNNSRFQAIESVDSVNDQAISSTTRRTYVGLQRQRLKTQSFSNEVKELEENDSKVEQQNTVTRRTYVGLNRGRLTTTTATSEIASLEEMEEQEEAEVEDLFTSTTPRSYSGLNRRRLKTTTVETNDVLDSNSNEADTTPNYDESNRGTFLETNRHRALDQEDDITRRTILKTIQGERVRITPQRLSPELYKNLYNRRPQIQTEMDDEVNDPSFTNSNSNEEEDSTTENYMYKSRQRGTINAGRVASANLDLSQYINEKNESLEKTQEQITDLSQEESNEENLETVATQSLENLQNRVRVEPTENQQVDAIVKTKLRVALDKQQSTKTNKTTSKQIASNQINIPTTNVDDTNTNTNTNVNTNAQSTTAINSRRLVSNRSFTNRSSTVANYKYKFTNNNNSFNSQLTGTKTNTHAVSGINDNDNEEEKEKENVVSKQSIAFANVNDNVNDNDDDNDDHVDEDKDVNKKQRFQKYQYNRARTTKTSTTTPASTPTPTRTVIENEKETTAEQLRTVTTSLSSTTNSRRPVLSVRRRIINSPITLATQASNTETITESTTATSKYNRLRNRVTAITPASSLASLTTTKLSSSNHNKNIYNNHSNKSKTYINNNNNKNKNADASLATFNNDVNSATRQSAKYQSPALRRKYQTRRLTTPATNAADENATEAPKTQNPLFKRRYSITSTIAPAVTSSLNTIDDIQTTTFTTDGFDTDETDVDQIAKSSIQSSLFNQIGDEDNSTDEAGTSIKITSKPSTKIISTPTPPTSQTRTTHAFEEILARRMDGSSTELSTRRPAVIKRRPLKTTPASVAQEKPAQQPRDGIFINRRRPNNFDEPFSRLNSNQAQATKAPPTASKYKEQTSAVANSHRQNQGYDYYDDVDLPLVGNSKGQQLRTVTTSLSSTTNSRRPVLSVRRRIINSPITLATQASNTETITESTTATSKYNRLRNRVTAITPASSLASLTTTKLSSSNHNKNIYNNHSNKSKTYINNNNNKNKNADASLATFNNDVNSATRQSAKYQSPALRRKYQTRRLTTPATNAADENATEAPKTQNPLFKRRYSITSTIAPAVTSSLNTIDDIQTTTFTTDGFDTDETDVDQIAKSSIQSSLFNQIGDEDNSTDEAGTSIKITSKPSTKIISTPTPPTSQTRTTHAFEEILARRMDGSSTELSTRRPAVIKRRPLKTTPASVAQEKPAQQPRDGIFINRRRPNNFDEPFSRLNSNQAQATKAPPTASKYKEQTSAVANSHRQNQGYDYYDDVDLPLVGNSKGQQLKVILHGRGIIECLDQGNFPHPLSCRKFISCAKFETGGVVGWEYTCPKGLSYDPVGGMCNWAAGLGCNE